MAGRETNQLVVLVRTVVDGWAGWARFTAPILTWFSAPVLAPAPGLCPTPVLAVCWLLGDVSGGEDYGGGKMDRPRCSLGQRR